MSEPQSRDAQRAALVTGGSSGIGLAIAQVLADEDYAITLCARRPDKLHDAAERMRAAGHEVEEVAANLSSEDDVKRAATAHRERFGRLDVLVNSAGIGIGASVGDIETRRFDLQVAVNLRAVVLFYRECVDLLTAAAEAHRGAMVFNVASIAGLRGEAWLSVYSATKHGVVGFTRAMNRELAPKGIRSTAICPGLVDTNMTAFARGEVAQEEMIRPEDVAGAVRWLLNTSPNCLVPELPIIRPGDAPD